MRSEPAQAAARLKELAEVLRAYTDAGGPANTFTTAIGGFAVLRSDHEKPPSHRVFKPALCITVQGAKWAVFGGRRCDYRAGQALVVSIAAPSRGTVSAASPSEPFLGVVMEIDPAVLYEAAEQVRPQPVPAEEGKSSAVCVVDLDSHTLDCALRAVRLLETPEAVPVLYPSILREICWRLLAGPGGEQIFCALAGRGQDEQLLAAVHTLKDHFAEPIRVEPWRFKALTAMSPLQYQKELRLIEARRLMLAGGANVESAAFHVGYESASQFSREYSRMFGRPPHRDVSALRAHAA